MFLLSAVQLLLRKKVRNQKNLDQIDKKKKS